MPERFGMVRAALLSVPDAARLLAADDSDDPLVVTAIALAAEPHVIEPSGSSPRAHATISRYISRMGGRATPYGLFAGTAAVGVGGARRLALQPSTHHRARVRVDVGALEKGLAEALDEVEIERWPVRRNPTVHRAGEQLRYTKTGDASADVVMLRPTPAIETLLRALGPDDEVLGAELIDLLQAASPATPRAALRDFLARLLDGQLLLRSVALIKPGVEPGQLAATALERVGDAERLDSLRTLLSTVCGPQPLNPQLHRRLFKAWDSAAERFAAFRAVPRHVRFHVDLELSMREASIDDRTVGDLESALGRVETVGHRHDILADFREAFRRRYEDAEVPLLHALDSESGLPGSDRRKVSRLAVDAGVRSEPGRTPGQQVRPEVVAVLDDWLVTGRDPDIGHLPAVAHPSARAVHAALLDDHQGRFHSVLLGGHQRTAAALLARFCLGRPRLADALREWTALEAAADGPDGPAIHAELVHNPGGRVGNVLIRPRVFDDAIALGGGAGATLGLDRLLLRLEGDSLLLRDRETGQPVVVALSSAHNVAGPDLDPVYRFLGDLAHPDVVMWTWGALGRLSHLPRVTCGAVIVALEQWRLRRDEIRRVLGAQDPAVELRRLLPGLGSRRWVGQGLYDQVLPIDLSSTRSVIVVLSRCVNFEDVELVELPHLESPAVAGPTGGHVGEVVLPLRGRGHSHRSGHGPAVPFDPAAGAGWVYFRYYTGVAGADLVVARAHRLARSLTRDGAVRGWFFVRYDDSGYHVRVRMRVALPDARGAVVAAMDRLGAALRDEQVVTSVLMDDYVPEVSRYGGPLGLARAESLFAADSDDVAGFVNERPDEQLRLYRAVADVLHWCSVLFASYQEGQQFLRSCGAGLGLSFAAAGNRQGRFFREHRRRLDDFLAGYEADPALAPRLRELRDAVVPRGQAFSHDVLGSALHMHCDRLFAADARRLEYLAYDLATRKLREYQARGEPRTGPREEPDADG
jgi:class I lanthipeptide synthase